MNTLLVDPHSADATRTGDEFPGLVADAGGPSGRKRTAASLERANRAYRVRAKCGHALVHAVDEAGLLQEMCRIAVESGGYRQAWIAYATGTAPVRVHAAAHAGYGDDAPMKGAVNWGPDGSYRGLAGEAIARGETRIARDILNEPREIGKRERALLLGYQSSIALVLKEEGRVYGALVLHAAERDAFDDEEIVLLDEFAADLSYGTANIRTRKARQLAEHSLRESERRLREMTDQAAVGMSRVDLNGVLVEVNQKFCDLLGYTRKELLGKTIKDITHPDDYGKGSKIREQAQRGARIAYETGEKRLLRKDGALIWVKRTMSAACDEAGRPEYLVSVIEDITGHKELEQQYRETFDQAAVGIVHTSEDGRYLRVNRKFAEMLGYDAAELVGHAAAEFSHPDDRDRIPENRHLLWDGKLDRLVEEKRYICKDGRVIWTNRTVSLARDASGKPMYFIRVIEDVTQRKEIEERYRATFDNAPVGIMHTAIDNYRILRANRTLCEMLGYTQDELLAMTSTDVVHPDFRFSDKPKYMEQLNAEEFRPFSSERKFLRKDGSTIWVNRTVSLVKDASGKPLYFIRMVEDISERKRAEETIANERALLRSVVDAVPERIYVKDREGRFLLQNAANVRAHGASSHEELLGKTVYDIFPRAMAERVDAEDQGIIASGKALIDRERGTADAAGNRSWVVSSKVPLRDAAGNVVGIVGVNRDITAHKLADQALKETEEQFRQLAHNIPQVFWMTDIDQNQLIYASPAYEAVSGRSIAQVKANPRTWLEAVHPDDRARVTRGRKRAAEGLYDELFRLVRPDGTVRWIHDRAFPIEDESGKAYRIAGIAEDVTERKLAEQQLTHLAHYDVLTNLPNRALFYDRLKQALAQAQRHRSMVGVMFIDVDRFKNVNDTLGHAVGDKLLQQASERLLRAVRAADTVGRLGGDEFAIVLSELTGDRDATLVAQKIMASFNEPFQLEGTDVYVTASIGITLYPDDSTEQDALIKNADAAMYRAKESGRNSYQFYTSEMNSRALEIMSMQNSLRRALDRDEFLLHYQPKASLADGRIVGLEALLRWRHPERGLVSPADFIPVLEETGFIVPVGEWVIRMACAQIRAWRRAGIEPVPVAVNLSARQFRSANLSATIIAALEDAGVEPRLIELEITESSLMQNADGAVVTLAQLVSYGLKVSIDDFGTGYSSLAYLQRFPLHALKIDRSFVADVSDARDDAPIIRAVISMAHSLGLKVVAEGVETATQLAFLAGHGCDEMQGYWFSRPLPAEDCGAWLRENRRLQLPPAAARKT